MQPNTFKKSVHGRSQTPILISGWKTPKLKVIFSNIVKPFYYPNSPQMARYSLTVIVDPEEHKEFMDKMKKMENTEKCSTQFRDEMKKDEMGNPQPTGKSILKFQTKEGIPIFKLLNGQPVPYETLKELPRDTEVDIIFEVARYTSKQTSQNGLSCRAVQILIHSMPEIAYKSYDAPESESAPF